MIGVPAAIACPEGAPQSLGQAKPRTSEYFHIGLGWVKTDFKIPEIQAPK